MAAPREPAAGTDDPEEYCEIQATVATGFEPTAREEAIKKLKCDVTKNRGHILLNIPIKDAKKVLELGGVDHLCVVIHRITDFGFVKDKEEALKQINKIIPQVNWDKGLRIWSQFLPFEHTVSPLPHTNDNNVTSPDGLQSSDADTVTNQKETGNGDPESPSTEPAAKKQKTFNPLLPKFRATCHRVGTNHSFQSGDAAASFGGAVQDYFGWNVNLKNFDIEVVLDINDEEVKVCLGLTKESMHKRNIVSFGPTTLRTTLAHNMLWLCKIKPGEVVCDPMCGGGTIPIEAAINWPDCTHICGDIHEKAWPRCQENIDAVNKMRSAQGKSLISVDLYKWDVTNLPLKDNSVDVFITDLPFGKRSGSTFDNRVLYPNALTEMARVCKHKTGRACLLTHDKRSLARAMQAVSHLWHRGAVLWINIGGLAAGVYMLHRNGITEGDGKNSSNSTPVDPSGKPKP